jgi:phosphotransferase system HPr-like phosphotransfer protein
MRGVPGDRGNCRDARQKFPRASSSHAQAAALKAAIIVPAPIISIVLETAPLANQPCYHHQQTPKRRPRWEPLPALYCPDDTEACRFAPRVVLPRRRQGPAANAGFAFAGVKASAGSDFVKRIVLLRQPSKGDKTVDAGSILKALFLGVGQGKSIVIAAEWVDEKMPSRQLTALIESRQ